MGQAQLNFLHFQLTATHYSHHMWPHPSNLPNPPNSHSHHTHHTQTLPQQDLHPKPRRLNLEIEHSRVIAAGTVQSRGLAGVGPSSSRFGESKFLSDFKVSSADLKSNREICLQGCDLPLLIENQIFFQIFKVEAVQCNAVKAPPPLFFPLSCRFSAHGTAINFKIILSGLLA